MTFIVDKFKYLQKVKLIKQRYGENANIILRDFVFKKPERRKVKAIHHNQELFNKRYPVPVYNVPRYDEYGRQINTYPLTEASRIRALVRRGGHEPTQFD